jgi:predicted RNA binding protein YcfA (HicA-like mRNA interferase family)
VSPALPVVSGQDVVLALGKIGFEQVGQRGSHVKRRDQGGGTVIVPTHREPARGALSVIASLDVMDTIATSSRAGDSIGT